MNQLLTFTKLYMRKILIFGTRFDLHMLTSRTLTPISNQSANSLGRDDFFKECEKRLI